MKRTFCLYFYDLFIFSPSPRRLLTFGSRSFLEMVFIHYQKYGKCMWINLPLLDKTYAQKLLKKFAVFSLSSLTLKIATWWKVNLNRVPWRYVHPRTDHVTFQPTRNVPWTCRPLWQFTTVTVYTVTFQPHDILLVRHFTPVCYVQVTDVHPHLKS